MRRKDIESFSLFVLSPESVHVKERRLRIEAAYSFTQS
jgi:hypothetical protein